MIVWRPDTNLSLQESITLEAGAGLYHYTYKGPLKANRDDYIFVTKDLVKYARWIAGVFDSSPSEELVYQFKLRLTLRIPDMRDKGLIESIRLYLNSTLAIPRISLKKRQELQNVKDLFEELFTGAYLDDGPNVRITNILTYLAGNTDFPEKCKCNGFHDTADGHDNYCLFKWRSKLETTGCMTYKEFKSKVN